MFLPDNSIFTPVTDPNMDPSRTANRRLSVEERITSFDEVDATYTEEQALNESGRCLKCPTHWCQKACPAGVPVTDFIARVRAHDYEGAYQLIRSASMLPEMCSRVCPQEKQCQSNCTRGIRGQSVGIGRLERFVIEEHYRSGKPDAAAPANGKRVAVIGAGPSGLSAAERLTDKGFSVTIYEGADRAGGLLEYGIPNMKLEKGVIARKVEAMQKRGVAFKLGTPVNADNADEIVKGYDAVILCVGTGNARSLKLEGAEHVRGILPAVEYLTASTKAVLDGVSAIVFASSLGLGVALSAGAIFLYQGIIALAAGALSPLLGDAVIAEMTCVGSLLIVALSFNNLGMTKIKIMNLLPAIFLPILLCRIL